jgi:hypothetical protein
VRSEQSSVGLAHWPVGELTLSSGLSPGPMGRADKANRTRVHTQLDILMTEHAGLTNTPRRSRPADLTLRRSRHRSSDGLGLFRPQRQEFPHPAGRPASGSEQSRGRLRHAFQAADARRMRDLRARWIRQQRSRAVRRRVRSGRGWRTAGRGLSRSKRLRPRATFPASARRSLRVDHPGRARPRAVVVGRSRQSTSRVSSNGPGPTSRSRSHGIRASCSST